GAILIVARRIEIGSKCQIVINYKKFIRIIIYAIEMTSELEIIANNVSYKLKIKDSKNVGKLLTIHNHKSPEYKDIYTFDNIILKNESFFKILRYSLNIAIALFYEKPGITRSILSWTIRITRKSECEETKELYYYALTIFTKLNVIDKRKADNIQFFLNDEQQTELLYASLMNRNDKAEMHEDLNNDRKIRYESACELMKKIESELQICIHERRKYTESTFRELEKGIINWLIQQRHDAQKNLIVAVIESSLSVGKIVIQPEKLIKLTEDADMKEKIDQ
ncbi:15886_t:CDS:2, partial [Cetraspora pellucida]